MTYPNLYHLKYFVDAVEMGSVSAAAQKNLVSHSAISQAIKSIELNLNIPLMLHKKRTFEVTPQGLALVFKTKSLLNALNSLGEYEAIVDGQIEGKVILGLSRSLSHAFLSPVLQQLDKSHPKVQLEVKLGTTGELLERSAQNLIDISLTIGHHPIPTLKQTLVRRGNFILIESIKKRAAKQFILTEPKYETELLKKVYFQNFKKPLPVFLEIGSWDLITELVTEEYGCGLVPDISLTHERRKKIRKISAPWFNCPYDIYLNEGKSFQQHAVKAAVAKVISVAVRSLV